MPQDNTTIAKEIVQSIDYDKILSVYAGTNGACCCGCSGKHTYRSDLRAEGTAKRGYEVAADECDDDEVRRIVGIINDDIFAERPEIDFNDGDYVATVQGQMLYIAYFRQVKE